jgi:hypothetical protein
MRLPRLVKAMKVKVNIPFFSSLPVPTVLKHKCDVCGFAGWVVYVKELDRWYCRFCLETVVTLLNES